MTTAALLATIISGLFAAAFATRAGWETAEPLPRAAQTRVMLAEILPGTNFRSIHDAPAMFGMYGQPLSWDNLTDLLFGDGGEYSLESVGGTANGLPNRPQETLDRTRQRLLDTGWTVYPPMLHDTYTTLAARRGSTTLTLDVHFEPTVYSEPTASAADSIFLMATIQRATPPAVYPIAILGGVAGAVVAFLLFSWASRRTDGQHLGRYSVTPLFGFTMILWWAPTLFAVPLMAKHHLDEPHPSWHPMWEWLGQPTYSLPVVVGGGCALLSLTLAATSRPRPDLLSTRAP
ncbi:hypothetical protein AB0L86_09090 [Micromonospora musae]|uniref:hypothetical protein n=1 Tax=Micromonospora musae TaxID=1894970 RepID=UPI0034434B09